MNYLFVFEVELRIIFAVDGYEILWSVLKVIKQDVFCKGGEMGKRWSVRYEDADGELLGGYGRIVAWKDNY